MKERIKQSFSKRPFDEIFKFGGIYLILSLINLRAKLFLTPSWFDGTLENNHELLLTFQYTNNEQSRLLQFYIPEMLHTVFGLSLNHAYIFQRWFFVFLAFLGFHFYLKKWFATKLAFAGVIFLAAVMPLTYFDHLQESAALLLFTFLLILWTIRENRVGWYTALLAISTLNNETVLCLPFVYFCYNFTNLEIKNLFRVSLRTAATALPAFAITGVIRYINRDQPHLGDPWKMPINLNGFLEDIITYPLDYWKAKYVYFLLVFGIFWVFAILKFSSKPLFLRRASFVIPIFVLIHFITGNIDEARQMLPLSFIIIPMALFYLFPGKPQNHAQI